jgi:hypothetical protein
VALNEFSDLFGKSLNLFYINENPIAIMKSDFLGIGKQLNFRILRKPFNFTT